MDSGILRYGDFVKSFIWFSWGFGLGMLLGFGGTWILDMLSVSVCVQLVGGPPATAPDTVDGIGPIMVGHGCRAKLITLFESQIALID